MSKEAEGKFTEKLDGKTQGGYLLNKNGVEMICLGGLNLTA